MPNKTVLVVDDEDILRRFCQRLLPPFGLDVIFANSVSEARQKIQQPPIDLLITDLGLPDGNGKDVVGFYKQKFSDGKVIIMTGYMLSDDESSEADRLGVNKILCKPFKAEELEKAVKEILGK